MIDGQVQTVLPSGPRSGSLSGQGDTDSSHSVNMEDTGNAIKLLYNKEQSIFLL